MAAIVHQIIYKLISIIISFSILFGGTGAVDLLKADSSNWNTNYKFVFVHGLLGWGSYDPQYKLMPYWGVMGGDLMEYLNDKGFDCYAASVAGTGSAWDRACELYAQLTGSVVDYGEAHSKEYNHERFGKDFSGIALIDEFDEEHKINILGHSFGGATVRLFASLMENGSEAERNATDEGNISPLFEGGKGDWIYSVTTLAAPHNGTTAYEVKDTDLSQYIDKSTLKSTVKTTIETLGAQMIIMAQDIGKDGRDERDYAEHDMTIDNALEMNKSISTIPNAYYFSIACNASKENEDGTFSPIDSEMEILFRTASKAMGSYDAVTDGGVVLDNSWYMNDGLVNTISAMAPFDAPSTVYDENHVEKGVWNIMPIYNGDHMSLEGGLMIPNDVKGLYVDLLSMINSLEG